MLPVFKFLLCTFFSINTMAQQAPTQQNPMQDPPGSPSVTAPSFETSLKQMTDGDNEGALTNLVALIKQNRNDTTLLYNAGLAAFKSEQFGPAAAYWRKALYLRPTMSLAHEGLSQIEDKTNTLEDYHWLSPLYRRLPFTILALLTMGLYALLGGLLIRLFKRKKEALDVNIWPPIFTGTALLPLMLVTALYYYQYLCLSKATILDEGTPIYARPDTEAPALTNLAAGNEVLILKINEDSSWVLVKKSETELGWATKQSLFIHSGPLSSGPL